MQEFQVNKNNLTLNRIVEVSATPIREGEILVEIERYSFTANNITYAVMGDMLRYWNFFPAHNNDTTQWGVIPVWGFANVVESNSQEVQTGERLFGYFPPAKSLVMKPTNVSTNSFMEGADHRADLPPGYNLYRRVSAEPNYDRATDNERMLLYPLYVTSFCLHDLLKSNDWYDAEQVIIISASSKTSIGLAYALEADEASPNVIGLTSARNLGFVNSLNIYDQSHSYDDLENIDASKPSVIIDMSANTGVISRLHSHLGDNMRFTSNVGLTHWDEPRHVEGIIKERSEQFFAPGHIQKLVAEWGRQDFEVKSMAFVTKTAAKSRDWLNMQELDGLNGLAAVYDDVCKGTVAADKGLIVVM